MTFLVCHNSQIKGFKEVKLDGMYKKQKKKLDGMYRKWQFFPLFQVLCLMN